MRNPSRSTPLVAVVAISALAACDTQDGATAPLLPDSPSERFTLELPEDPTFVSPGEAAADPNPYFPLVPGIAWTYESEGEDGEETTVDAVTGDTRTIDGVEATVVRDEVYVEGELIELTRDWYAQDTEGNVWYMGEASCEWEPGEYVEGNEDEEECGPSGDPAGSWEAGVDGAEAGVIMWADPLEHRGKAYRQEYYEDEAEDMAKVLHGGLTVTVPAGTFTDCIETMDWTPLEPGEREFKFYCSGYGMVLEVQPKGGRIRNALVDHEGLPVGPGA
jgi:hypothetical protein